MDLGSQAAGIGALADDTRRALYQYVVARPDAVGREEAATALALPLHRVSFHLDRLVAEGLLAVEYRRLGGRSGPGAGRPSKLYRRAEAEFAVSLPSRRYDLVGDILADAVTRAAGGDPLPASLDASAHQEGLSIGRAATGAASDPVDPDGEDGEDAQLADVARVLATQGYDPRVGEDSVVLANCPFDTLARKHTELVCGLNRSFVQGVVDGLGHHDVTACLEPAEGQCCVTARRDRESR